MVNFKKGIKLIFLSLLVFLMGCQSETKIDKLKVDSSSKIKVEPKETVVPKMNQSLRTKNPSEWCFTMKVPDGNWALQLNSIYQGKSGNYIVLAKLSRKKGSGIQVISRSTICAPLKLAGEQVNLYIMGKTWGWDNPEKAKFVKKWPNMNNAAKFIYRPIKTIGPIKPKPVDILDR